MEHLPFDAALLLTSHQLASRFFWNPECILKLRLDYCTELDLVLEFFVHTSVPSDVGSDQGLHNSQDQRACVTLSVPDRCPFDLAFSSRIEEKEGKWIKAHFPPTKYFSFSHGREGNVFTDGEGEEKKEELKRNKVVYHYVYTMIPFM